MLELILIAAASTPRVFANEYCWARRWGADHQAALVQAADTWGGLEHSKEAEQFMRDNCKMYTEWS